MNKKYPKHGGQLSPTFRTNIPNIQDIRPQYWGPFIKQDLETFQIYSMDIYI